MGDEADSVHTRSLT